MKHILLIIVFLSTSLWASTDMGQREYKRERLFDSYAESLADHDLSQMYFSNEEELNIFLDTAQELFEQGVPLDQIGLAQKLHRFLSWKLTDVLTYRVVHTLNLINKNSSRSKKHLEILEDKILRGEASAELLTLYSTVGLKSLDVDEQTLMQIYPNHMKSIKSVNMGFYPQDRERLQDLFDYDNVPDNFRNGRFEEVPRLFVFCRHNRRYHCLMMMKDRKGEVVRTQSGKMWSMPVLALARRSKSYDEKGGYTPSGVYTVDSVMPYADQTRKFGDFRRLILNFIPKTYDEQLLKSFLPESSHSYAWWRESVIGRDIGRNLLRIHGAGYKNYNFFSKHYPFVKTIGCIGTREGRYGRTRYKDQRVLLDKMMKASGLEPRYENEEKLYALLYLVEINNISDHVSLDEMIWYLQRS